LRNTSPRVGLALALVPKPALQRIPQEVYNYAPLRLSLKRLYEGCYFIAILRKIIKGMDGTVARAGRQGTDGRTPHMCDQSRICIYYLRESYRLFVQSMKTGRGTHRQVERRKSMERCLRHLAAVSTIDKIENSRIKTIYTPQSSPLPSISFSENLHNAKGGLYSPYPSMYIYMYVARVMETFLHTRPIKSHLRQACSFFLFRTYSRKTTFLLDV
jgi:hypothetical protein